MNIIRVGMRKFKPGYIEGSRNLRASSVKDHATSSMAMSLKLSCKPPTLVSLYCIGEYWS